MVVVIWTLVRVRVAVAGLLDLVVVASLLEGEREREIERCRLAAG